MNVSSLLFSSSLIILLSSGMAEEFEGLVIPKDRLEPFLQEYCISCHGPDKQRGQVRFDEAAWHVTNGDTAQRWQDVLDQLNGGDMPPEDEKQPSGAELGEILDVLTGSILQARKMLTDHGGEISMRRLNRREYAETIDDLFGFQVPAEMIPDDGEAATFDTVGAEQFFTSSHFEKYLELGREIASVGLTWAARPRSEVKTTRREAEEHVTPRLREALADLDEKMRMKQEGKTWKEMGFKDEGEAEIIFSQFKNRAGKPRQYLANPLVETGIYFSEVNNETRQFGTNHGGCDPRATYQLRVRAGIHGAPPEIRKFLHLTDNVGTIGVLKVRGTAEDPETVEMSYRPTFESRNVTFRVQENRADIRVLDAYLRRLNEEEPAAIWMDWLETEGPFYAPQRSFFEELLHPQTPERGKPNQKPWNFGNARELIAQFAFRAFRHQEPSEEFLHLLVTHFEELRSGGMSFDHSIAEVFGIILASPQFLFIQEAGDAKSDQKRTLDAREFAIRLAYFLWSGPPDDQLYAAAADGSILLPETLHAEVDRMLDSPKADSFIEGFTRQWAELERFDAITVDENEFFLFNKGIRHSAKQEVVEFFKTLVAENLPVSNLVDSDFVVINALLSQHYGIEGVESNAFQKVALPTKSPRGGLLGQTAFLTLGSNGERSSPVIRGAFVMEKLLHDKPAPPPPNVPELGSNSKKPATNREMVVLHQSQAVCASCHKKMDVIGFGLENFDTIGKWRETEMVGRKPVPIDPGGRLPGGAVFEDIEGLKSVLLDQNAGLAKEMIESLLAYALGRTIEFSDADDVDGLLTALEPQQFRVRSMIHGIAASDLLRTK